MIAEHTLDKSFPAGSRKWRDKLFICAVAVFFFLLPLQTRYIFRAPTDGGVPYEYGTLSLFLVEVLGWVVISLGIWKIKIITFRAAARNVIKSFLPLCLLTALSYLSILWAPDKAVALQAAVRLLEGVVLLVVLAASRDQATTKSGLVTSVAWAFLVGATLQAILGIYQFLTQSSFSSSFLGMALHDPRALGTAVVEFADQRWLRAYGGLPHPNILGGYLAIATAVVIAFLHKLPVRQNLQRLLLSSTIFVLITGIFFSFSRSAWVAGIVLLGYWVIKLFRDRTQWQMAGYWLLLIGYLVFLVFLFRPLVAARVLPVQESRLEVKSRVERVEGAREAWQLARAHPVLGVGIGNYTQAVAREVRLGEPLYTYQPAHNVFLLVWAELGIMGLVLFMVILYWILKQSNFLILNSSFLILLTFDHYLWSLPFGILLFWGILGLFTYNPQDRLDPVVKV